MNNINKLDMQSKNIVNENIKKISELFPNIVIEGKIDFNALKQELSDVMIEEGKEKYQLTWAGKNEAKVNANTPINKILRPLKNKSVSFDETKNVYIEGDNLEVLKLLQESYLNKIKCIYIDPPYNTGNDFVYNDRFVNENELEESGQIDEYNNKLVSNTESNGKFHSDWLSMMYPRLKLARNLLTDTGAIFISIDDNEIDNLKKLCNEIFGESNHISTIIVESASTGGVKRTFKDRKFLKTKEYIVMYAKNCNKFSLKPLYDAQDVLDSHFSIYFDGNEFIPLNRKIAREFPGKNISFKDYLKDNEIKEFILKNDSNIYQTDGHGISDWIDKEDVIREKIYKDDSVEVFKAMTKDGLKKEIYKTSNGTSNSFAKMQPLSLKTEIINNNKEIALLRGDLWKDFYKDMGNVTKEGEIIYPNGKKPLRLICDIIKAISDENDIIMDFFSGSATTAHACMQVNIDDNYNRRFILVQIPENIDYTVKENQKNYDKYGFKTICDLGEERIRRAGNKIKAETNANIDYGFRVYKVDSSNMKDIYYAPTELQQSQLNMFESNIKEDRTAEDLLTQVILDLGLTLDLSIEEKKILDNNVYFVENNSLVACFDNVININIIDEICKYNPLKIVFKESSFKIDSDKINTFERIKKLSSETEINII